MRRPSLPPLLVVGLAFSLLPACGPDYGEAEPIESFAIVRVSSSASSYEAEATFMSPYQWGDCSTSPAEGGCSITRCKSGFATARILSRRRAT